MKPTIHPKYQEVEARCACGATWKTRSTKPELHLEICSACHPFFTGRQKLIDTEGRGRAVHQEVRSADVAEPGAGRQGQERKIGRDALDPLDSWRRGARAAASRAL